MTSLRTISIRRAAAAALVVVMTLSILPAATMAANVPSQEIRTTEWRVLAEINRTRANRGLQPLRMAFGVRAAARERSNSMKSQNYFGHVAPNGVHIGHILNRRGIQHFDWGENIGWLTFLSPKQTAVDMVEWWKGSPGHRRLMLSPNYNYVGIGVAREGRAAYITAVFASQRDHSAPRSGMIASSTGISVASGARASRGVTVRWWGRDRLLQHHTSGIKGFIVQHKRVGGNWRTVRHMTTARQMTMNLVQGQHKFRVRAVDRGGNVGAWLLPVKVTVR
jgi:uncharacterized protein YkwD